MNFPKWGKAPLQSWQRFSKLLAVSVTNILNWSLLRVKCAIRDNGEDPHSEFSVCEERTEKDLLENENLKYTFALRFPGKRTLQHSAREQCISHLCM